MIRAISNVSNTNHYQTFKGKKVPTHFTSLYIPEEPHITADMEERFRARMQEAGFCKKLKNKIAEKLNNLSEMNMPDARNIIDKDGNIFHLMADGSLVKIMSDGSVIDGIDAAQNLQDFKDLLPAEVLLNTHKIGDLSDHADILELLRSVARKTGDVLDVAG